MTSVVEIINAAAINLGEDPVTNAEFDNGENKMARLGKRRYPAIRDAVLRAHPWNCAMKRASLASIDPKPIWGVDNAFQLPADCLRVLRTQRREVAYKVEGRTIVANAEAPFLILYTHRIEDPNLFDALLVEAIAARLAADLAHPITQSTSLIQVMFDLYRQKIIEARGMDGQEGTGDTLIADEWLASRRIGVTDPFGIPDPI